MRPKFTVASKLKRESAAVEVKHEVLTALSKTCPIRTQWNIKATEEAELQRDSALAKAIPEVQSPLKPTRSSKAEAKEAGWLQNK